MIWHTHTSQENERVWGLIKQHGLGVLSAHEVSLLLSHQREGTPFVKAFKKREVCEDTRMFAYAPMSVCNRVGTDLGTNRNNFRLMVSEG